MFWTMRGLFLASALLASFNLAAQTSALIVDAASPQSAMRHGATGWLYGLAAPGVPSQSMIVPLNPGIAAQKAPGGLQHPAGDALLVAPGYRAIGGKEIQIYVQDIYPDWPYNQLGMGDFFKKITTIVHEVERSGDPGFFVYVPFNEPDNNWYGYTGESLQRFLTDWQTVVLAIRSIDPKARIAGPNFEHFKPDTYRQFLIFARDHHVMPDEITWHELHDDFFTGWYLRYSAYREFERQLGVPPLPVVINEYGREKGDLAVPGNLIQWIARFETSGVDACLAFWTPAGTLSDLVARSWSNRPTGAWWLYRWYGQMSGIRLNAESPNANAIGLQGIASYDQTKKQVRILFGGTAGRIDVRLRGLAAFPSFNVKIRVTIWRIDSSGIEPSSGPNMVLSELRPVSSGEVTLTTSRATAGSAYYAILSPAFEQPSTEGRNFYLAAYATLFGQAVPNYVDDSATVGVGDQKSKGAAEFIVQVPADGFYRFDLRYKNFGPPSAGDQGRRMAFTLNGRPLRVAVDPPAKPGDVAAIVFLPGGVNRMRFNIQSSAALQSLELSPSTGQITECVSKGLAEANAVGCEDVSVRTTGPYNLIVTYANAAHAHGGQIEEFADLSINGAPPKRYYFKNTFDPAVFRSAVIPITMRKGRNSIRFFTSADHQLPNINKVQVAPAAETDHRPSP